MVWRKHSYISLGSPRRSGSSLSDGSGLVYVTKLHLSDELLWLLITPQYNVHNWFVSGPTWFRSSADFGRKTAIMDSTEQDVSPLQLIGRFVRCLFFSFYTTLISDFSSSTLNTLCTFTVKSTVDDMALRCFAAARLDSTRNTSWKIANALNVI